MQINLDRVERHLEDFTDLFVTHLLNFTQNQDRAVRVSDVLESELNLALGIDALGNFLRIRARVLSAKLNRSVSIVLHHTPIGSSPTERVVACVPSDP